MDSQYKPTYALLGDVGGTNIRLELVLIQPPADQPLERVKKEKIWVKDFDVFEKAIEHFLAGVPEEKYPEVAAIGIAGPVDDNKVSLANVQKWGVLVGDQLAKNLKIKSFIFLNDFTANSFGLLLMKQDNFISLNGLHIHPDHTRGVLGPGTGLGNSLIYSAPFRQRERIYVLPSEGGHVDCPYVNEETAQYLKFLCKTLNIEYASLERSFCGPAIPVMYQFLASKHPDLPGAQLTPSSEQIIQQFTLNPGEENLYKKTCHFFMDLYCNAISNFIMTHMCTGGLYLVGGLTNAIYEELKKRKITEGHNKRHPQVAATLNKVPIVISKEVDLGLKGAYVYARRIISDEQHE